MILFWKESYKDTKNKQKIPLHKKFIMLAELLIFS